MFCCCYFLSFSFYFFIVSFFIFLFLLFNDRLEQKDLRMYQTDLHQISRVGRHVAVDVQSGIGFAITEGTLPWQPVLGAKSAKRLPLLGLAFHKG